MGDPTIEYYQRRAHEYAATSWEQLGGDSAASKRVCKVLSSLPSVKTLDVGCGTGYVSRWLPGQLTLMDTNPTMLSIARRRVPDADFVRGLAPAPPFADGAFDRVFTGNVYGHLRTSARSEFVTAMLRVAGELVVLEQLATSGSFTEGPEERALVNGTRFTIHKCYFTVARLLEELGGGDILMAGPVFAIIRRFRQLRDEPT